MIIMLKLIVMKNSEIHSGLDKKEIRDFLSLALVKIFEAITINAPKIIPFDEKNPKEWSIKEADEQIKYYQRRKELLTEQLAVIKLIEYRSWLEFDVSDYTQKDLKYKTWMSFIGTEDEYKELFETIKNKTK